MSNYIKNVLLSACLLILATILVGCGHDSPPANAKKATSDDLLRLIQGIEPWRASRDYRSNDWTVLVETARQIQQADPLLVQDALGRFVSKNIESENGDFAEMSKVFLLMRVTFDIPENDSTNRGFNVPVLNHPNAESNPDGTYNNAWPLRWNSGDPKLVARYNGLSGPSHALGFDFQKMRAEFPYRDLSKFRGN